MKTFLSIFLTLIGLLLIIVIFVNTGWYNVSAMNNENGILKWFFKTTKENSIEYRTEDIKVPDLKNAELVNLGFAHYKEMCQSCHGAPGKEESELSKGLNPPAPNLVKISKYLSPKEIFWVTKNGIKMTGMPAWGKTHSDHKIWAITAAVKELSNMSPAVYDSLGNGMDDDD